MSKIIQVWKANNFGKGVLNGSQDFFRITPDPSTSGGGAVDSVNGQTGVVVLDKSDIGLDQVDNTSDLNKPISTATQTALNATVKQLMGADGSVVSVPVTTETIIYSFPIPANTLKGDVLNSLKFPTEKITAAATVMNLRMYASDSAVTLGNQFAFFSNSAVTRLAFIFERDFRITGGNLDPYKFSSTSRVSNLGDVVAGVANLVPFNVAVNNWIHITAQFNTTGGDMQVSHGVLNYK
jgi:hypothetical protein